MEITAEIKAKVFAQYLGQKYTDETAEEPEITTVNGETITCFELYPKAMDTAKLILKPLSAISDEDAIEVCNMLETVNPQFFLDSLNGKGGVYRKHTVDSILTYQFLQSKGYDLPHYLLDGKTLHEAGLAVYETSELTNDKCGKCEILGDAAPCDECYYNNHPSPKMYPRVPWEPKEMG